MDIPGLAWHCSCQAAPELADQKPAVLASVAFVAAVAVFELAPVEHAVFELALVELAVSEPAVALQAVYSPAVALQAVFALTALVSAAFVSAAFVQLGSDQTDVDTDEDISAVAVNRRLSRRSVDNLKICAGKCLVLAKKHHRLLKRSESSADPILAPKNMARIFDERK